MERASLSFSLSLLISRDSISMKERVYLSLSLLSRSMGIVFLSFSLSLIGENGERLSLSLSIYIYMNEDGMPLSMMIVESLSLSMRTIVRVSLYQ